MQTLLRCAAIVLFLAFLAPGWVSEAGAARVTDALGRTVELPGQVRHVICSGSGCLRLLTYLQAQDMVVGADDMETRESRMDSRPYALANPQFRALPVFGQFRGRDDPERILTLDPQPDVILKTYSSSMGHDPQELQDKTGIPVVALSYGDLGALRPAFYKTLRQMGGIVGREQRAEAVIRFFDEAIADLRARTATVPEQERPGVFLGGVAFKGPHGFQSTEPAYPPFQFVNARNLALDTRLADKELRHSDIAKEQIVAWDPDILFLDLSTLQMGEDAGGLHELRTDPAYRTLSAVRQGRVYGVLPYNWYTKNYGSILADAYFIGSVLYPERFSDLDPAAKADEIYTFLVGAPVFQRMNQVFGGLAFQPVPVD
jgi:iron complex transport system substrate-binding protein